MSSVLIRRNRRQGGREGHVTMEAETEVMLPQAKEHPGLPGSR